MLDGSLHIQPLQFGLLAGYDYIDVVPAAQAMIGHREKAIGIRWQIDANNVGFLVHYVIDEPRILMSKAVMVLAPDMRCEQVIERGDRAAPFDMACDLQPLRVLVEHGIDDVNEGFVTREKSVSAGEEVALQPALAHVFT